MTRGTMDARTGAHMVTVLKYEILPDGRVEVTGPKSKGLINSVLPDGSRVQGGITDRGQLFGNRTTVEGISHDLIWKPDADSYKEHIGQSPVPVLEPKDVLRVPAAEYKSLQDSHKALATEVADLRAQLKQLRAQADARLKTIKHEYARLSRVKRWQVAAVPSATLDIEGLNARMWELEDDANKLKYLIVVKTAPGTSSKVELQWMGDLQARLDAQLGDKTSYYIVLANDMSVVVNELIPGPEEELQEFDQF